MKTHTFELDKKAKSLAVQYVRTEALLLSVLMEMRRKRVFAELNATSIFDYCERVLKLSRAQAYYFKTVAETSEKIPELKKAVTEGQLSLSQARRIAPVVTVDNHKEWIEKAKHLPQAKLEKEVTAANPKAHPREKIKPVAGNLSELKVPVDEATEKNLLFLKEILSQKLRRNAKLSDVIAFAAKETREKYDPEKKAKRAKTISSGNSSKREKYRTPIPASIKHQVISKGGFQCSHVGSDGKRCQQQRWLHFHHDKPVSEGGQNTADNLSLVCSLHHGAHHSNRMRLKC